MRNMTPLPAHFPFFAQKIYQTGDYPRSQIVLFREFFRTAPLEIWHAILCLSTGLWILRVGYSTYDLQLYSPLLHYLSPTFFTLLFIGLGISGIVGLVRDSRWLRRGVAAVAAILWGFAATYYLMGELHPFGFLTCVVFAAQQMTVFIGLRKVVA